MTIASTVTPDINDLPANRLREMKADLEQRMAAGTITPAQADRLTEIKDALGRIDRALRKW